MGKISAGDAAADESYDGGALDKLIQWQTRMRHRHLHFVEGVFDGTGGNTSAHHRNISAVRSPCSSAWRASGS